MRRALTPPGCSSISSLPWPGPRFTSNIAAACSWLMVALHQDNGGLLEVFDAWLLWLQESRPTRRESAGADEAPYYARSEFSQDLLEFVRNRCLHRARNRG